MGGLPEKYLYKTSIYGADVDFFIEHLAKITDSLNREPPSEFVERVRYIPKGLTPFPGKFSFEKFPYFRKIVDCFSPLDPTREVVLMKGNQMGATTAILETIVLYNIMGDPKAQMCVTADAGLARTSVRTRIEAMIDNAGARDLIRSQSRKERGAVTRATPLPRNSIPAGIFTFSAAAVRRGSAVCLTRLPWRMK